MVGAQASKWTSRRRYQKPLQGLGNALGYVVVGVKLGRLVGRVWPFCGGSCLSAGAGVLLVCLGAALVTGGSALAMRRDTAKGGFSPFAFAR